MVVEKGSLDLDSHETARPSLAKLTEGQVSDDQVVTSSSLNDSSSDEVSSELTIHANLKDFGPTTGELVVPYRSVDGNYNLFVRFPRGETTEDKQFIDFVFAEPEQFSIPQQEFTLGSVRYSHQSGELQNIMFGSVHGNEASFESPIVEINKNEDFPMGPRYKWRDPPTETKQTFYRRAQVYENTLLARIQPEVGGTRKTIAAPFTLNAELLSILHSLGSCGGPEIEDVLPSLNREMIDIRLSYFLNTFPLSFLPTPQAQNSDTLIAQGWQTNEGRGYLPPSSQVPPTIDTMRSFVTVEQCWVFDKTRKKD